MKLRQSPGSMMLSPIARSLGQQARHTLFWMRRKSFRMKVSSSGETRTRSLLLQLKEGFGSGSQRFELSIQDVHQSHIGRNMIEPLSQNRMGARLAGRNTLATLGQEHACNRPSPRR